MAAAALSFLMISSAFFLAPAQASDQVQLENWPVVRVGPAGSTLEPSVVLDEDGVVHLVYLDRNTTYTDWYQRPNHLRYANYSQGAWAYENLQSGFFSFADIALDADGNAHILCAVRYDSSTEIVYWNNANLTWASENVTHITAGKAKNVDMAVDADGKVHAVMAIRDDQEENWTYDYVTNAQGAWELVPFHSLPAYDIQGNEMICPPDIEIDGSGRAHIAYVQVENSISSEWGSGDWTIQLLTRDGDDWTDAKNITLPDWCNSLSLRLDADGYEHVLYHCVSSSTGQEGPVRLAAWNASGLSWGDIADGTWLCELHLDEDGDERLIFMHQDGHFFVGEYGEGASDRSVRYPAGTYAGSRDPGDMNENGIVILLFDTMSPDLLLYMPGSVSLYPEISEVERNGNEVFLAWEPVGSGTTIGEYRIYRTAIWGEVVPITVDSGLPFIYSADVNSMTDATVGNIPVWTLLRYRISAIADGGVEYLGEMETIQFSGGGEGGFDANDLRMMAAAAAITSVSFTITLWWLIRKRK